MSIQLNQISLGKLIAVLKGAAILPLKADSVGRLGRISGKLTVKNKGEFIVGRNVSFYAKQFPSCISVAKNAKLWVGDNVFFNYGLDIGCTKSIRIGSNTIIGPMVNIIDTNFHPVDAEDRSVNKEIDISANVWIGRGAVILPGVRIGENSVIAAGSIVTRDIPDNVLAGGTPARVIREIHVPEDWIRRIH
ncbi:DapH/DapD/GlmU-related protein [Cohnella luojiensis]|uniref:Acetyltransferase n=1 Tax=Cohnella luojiensis TaxID=652876 RepID=A0A4Y8M6B5_9BACL|nr:DapH/DapD/GlmU-related protein [Cohnella luojiensis]TFE28177.1 acetyltransferase [Cohnella luojiensis]